MIPAHFVVAPHAPAHANGKIDSKSSPLRISKRPTQPREHVAPRTPTESHIAAIWAEALGIASSGSPR